MSRKMPRFITFAECKRIVHSIQELNPEQRKGQAFCNYYNVPTELDRILYYEESEPGTIHKIMNWQSSTDYQE